MADLESAPPPPPLEFADRDGSPGCCTLLWCCMCRKVGNMIVVSEKAQRPGEKRRLRCVVGPYWAVMMCITTPLILAPCVGALYFGFTRVHIAVSIVFMCAVAFNLASLWLTACSDPGLVVRYDERPEHASNSWAWNDQTRTWRPRTARYADDCRVLVDKYDHTCPWTGTAIGGSNIMYFHVFTGSIMPLLFFLIIYLVIAMAST